MTACRNCGVLLQGRFCHACGQKAAASDVSLHELLHEGLEEFAHVDGKAARTLKLLVTKPGALTKEFLEGRRARYISPLRLYLTCSLLFFALSALAPESSNRQIQVTATDVTSDEDRRKVARILAQVPDLREPVLPNASRS